MPEHTRCSGTVETHTPSPVHTAMEALWGWAGCYRGGWLVHGLAHSIRLGILFRHWTETSIALRQSSLSHCLSPSVSQSRISIISATNNRQCSLFSSSSPSSIKHPSLYLSAACQLSHIFNHTFLACRAFTLLRYRSGWDCAVCLLTRCDYRIRIRI